jgi:hypothetical protein
MTQAPESRVPLDEVMLAMDVVDTLRHERSMVEAELDSEQRERQFVARVQSIYEGQGIDVSEAVIAEGVRALREERFRYRPPARSFEVRLAGLYVERGKWARRAAIAVGVVLLVWLAFAVPAHLQRQARLAAYEQGLLRLQKEYEGLQARALAQRGELAATGAKLDEHAGAAVRELFGAASRTAETAAARLEKLGTGLFPGPDASAHADDPDGWNRVVDAHAATLTGLAGELGQVEARLADIERLRGTRHLVEVLLERLRGVEVPAAERQEIEGIVGTIEQALAQADATAARAGIERLERRIEDAIGLAHWRAAAPGRLTALTARLDGAEVEAGMRDEMQGLAVGFLAAVAAGERARAEQTLAELTGLVDDLEQAYELRIVSGPGRRSGVWRENRQRGKARNHYIIVEAIGPRGRKLPLRVANEETGKKEVVREFGIRVPESVYEQVKADQLDNGLIDAPVFGVKRRGAREVEYRYPVAGGRITSW